MASAQLSDARFVSRVMRSAFRLSLSALFVATACARPVLYYPEPLTAEAKPADAKPAARANPSAGVPLMTVSESRPVGSASASADIEYLRSRQIIVPVAGADMARVEDSFNDARDGDRVHRAIDILAPRGTPILSADNGRIVRMTTSALGGISMYTIDPEQRIVYYYAHMDHYNDAMSPGKTIWKGDTLGFVGTTGNAPKNTPHLHFQVMRWPADGKYWNGEPINPFDLLGGHTQAATATPHR
jgi:murein DD-endopeptidase MepM/ murein hydrolase activator NlpD